jgi:hypothetical protein
MVDALDPGRIYGKSPTPSEHPFSIDAHFIMPGLEHFGSMDVGVNVGPDSICSVFFAAF